MARNCRFQQPFVKGVISLAVVLSMCGCEATVTASNPHAADARRGLELQGELSRLSARLALLENQILLERQNAARMQQESVQQRVRIAALETRTAPAPVADEAVPPSSVSARGLSAEAELRLTLQLLMRAIERLDISADEKAMLKNSLRPARAIDRDNPWSMAQY
ncbi:MAG TPA: hypothetical protein VIV60_24525 [Polyangiaceae bacterium]